MEKRKEKKAETKKNWSDRFMLFNALVTVIVYALTLQLVQMFNKLTNKLNKKTADMFIIKLIT
ncbi:MAG: hypothetical protein ACI9UR_002419 [Bacteroidia bacterium]|jgi:hypothetical protein